MQRLRLACLPGFRSAAARARALVLSMAVLSMAALSTAPAARAETASPLRRAALSAELFALGLRSGDALLMLSAAQLRKALDLQPLDPEGPPGEAEDPGLTGWEEMISLAIDSLPEDDPLRALAADISAQSYKGVIYGPVYRIRSLGPDARNEHADLTFRGGDYAEVYAEAPPGSDLNLSVYDAAGLLVCADSDPSHVAYCGWRPAVDGHFTLVLHNPGSAEIQYALMTN